jgi:hypothetical protein
MRAWNSHARPDLTAVSRSHGFVKPGLRAARRLSGSRRTQRQATSFGRRAIVWAPTEPVP